MVYRPKFKHSPPSPAITVDDASEDGAGWVVSLLDELNCFHCHLETNLTYDEAVFQMERHMEWFAARGLKLRHYQEGQR